VRALSFEEAQDALDMLVAEIPQEIFHGLNGGVALREDELLDADGLLILGQYHYEPRGLGRYVTINYGSLMLKYAHLSPRAFIARMKKTLHHELTHHLEGMAGDTSLEVQDEIDRARMLHRRF
jgi:hypothetical protein